MAAITAALGLTAACGAASDAAKQTTADALTSALQSNNNSTVNYLCDQAGYDTSQDAEIHRCISDFIGNIPTDCVNYPYCL